MERRFRWPGFPAYVVSERQWLALQVLVRAFVNGRTPDVPAARLGGRAARLFGPLRGVVVLPGERRGTWRLVSPSPSVRGGRRGRCPTG